MLSVLPYPYNDIVDNHLVTAEEWYINSEQHVGMLGDLSDLLDFEDALIWNTGDKTEQIQRDAWNILRSRLDHGDSIESIQKGRLPGFTEYFQHDENGILRTYKLNGVEALRTIPPAYYLNEGASRRTDNANRASVSLDSEIDGEGLLEAQAGWEKLEDRNDELDVIRVGDEDEANEPSEGRPDEDFRSSTPSSLFGDEPDEEFDSECGSEQHSQDSRSVSPSSQADGSQTSSREPTPSLYFTPSQSPSQSPSPPPIFTPPASAHGRPLNAHPIHPHAYFSGKSSGNSLPPQVQFSHLLAQGVPPPISAIPIIDPFTQRLAYSYPGNPISVSSASNTPEPPAFVQGSSQDGQDGSSISTGSEGSPTNFVWDSSSGSQSALTSSKKRKLSKEPDSDYEPQTKKRRSPKPTTPSTTLKCLFIGCPTPGKLYPNQKERNRHMDIHFPHRFACPGCDTTFSRPESVKRHVETDKKCKHNPACAKKAGNDYAIREPYWRSFPWDSRLMIPSPSDPLYPLAMRTSP